MKPATNLLFLAKGEEPPYQSFLNDNELILLFEYVH